MSFGQQMPNLPVLADQLLPFLLSLLRQQTSVATASGVPTAQHELSGGLHTGVLADSQAPQFLKMDGSRALTGSLSVIDGVQIDGVDISVHAGDPAAHHAPVTAGALISVLGQQVGIAGGNQQYQVPVTGASPFAPSWTTLAAFAGAGLAFSGGQFAVGVANTGAAGLSVEADAIRLTSSANPGAAASVLASDASGYLTLVRLVASERLRTPLIDTASGNLTASPAADLMLSPGSNLVKLASGKTLQSDGYASQSTGMRITHAGEGDFRYLFVDEMHAKSFIADLEQALAGGQIISKSVAVLAGAFTAPGAGGSALLHVRDLPSAPNMAVFQEGDAIRLRTFSRAGGGLSIADCWGVVYSYVDGNGTNLPEGWQQWDFYRSAAPNAGAMAAGTVIQPDAIVLDYGTSGNGFYEVNAIDGAYGLNSPYAQIVSWATHPATGQTVRSRLGNLRGIFGASNEYGLYAGAGTATSDAYLRISNTEVGLYNLPLRMYTGGTERVHIAAHNDVWIGPSSSDKRFLWDGSTLTINGAINVTGGNAATLDNVTGAINLVANASFETDTNDDGLADGFEIYNNDGGSVPTTASRVAGEKSTWAQRISWTGTNASTKGIYFNSVTAKRANVDYVLTFWARTNTAVNLQFAENLPPATQTALVWPQANTTWQFYARRLRWSSTPAANFYISIQNAAAIANGWIEFDNLQVVESTDIVPWALAPTDKADTSLKNSAISTLISGANIRVGSGTKDSTLNGWNIDSGEIVGQAAGVDQVVLNTSGQIAAGGGNVILNGNGVTLNGQSYSGSNYSLLATRPQNKSVNFNISSINEWSIWNWYNTSTNTRALNFSVFPNNGVWETVLRIEESYNAFITRVNGELNVEGRLQADTVGYDWSELTPINNWVNYGNGAATLGIKRFGNMISVKGFLRAAAAIANLTAICSQLPSEYRPAQGRHFLCAAYISGVETYRRVFVPSTGYIQPLGAFSTNDWISLEFTYFTGG